MQAGVDAEHLQELPFESQVFPIKGSLHDGKLSEQRHSPRTGSQNSPVFLPSHEAKEPHLHFPSIHVSRAILQSDEFGPLHAISKHKLLMMCCSYIYR